MGIGQRTGLSSEYQKRVATLQKEKEEKERQLKRKMIEQGKEIKSFAAS